MERELFSNSYPRTFPRTKGYETLQTERTPHSEGYKASTWVFHYEISEHQRVKEKKFCKFPWSWGGKGYWQRVWNGLRPDFLVINLEIRKQ